MQKGKITFKKLKFGKDDLGKTYTYTVSEVAGTDYNSNLRRHGCNRLQ